MGPAPTHAITPQEFVEECYAYKRAHAPQGAFMHKLLAGRCSRAELHAWMKEAYYYTEPAEPNIAAWLSHAPVVPDKAIYRALARNLAGEMGYIKEGEHFALYGQMLEGLGISADEVRAHVPLATTLGAAAASAEVIYEALRDHYHLDEKTLEFYAVHVEAEEEHGENAMQAVEWFAATYPQQVRVRRAFRWSVLAHTAMAEGYDRLLAAGAA
jgi:pyrroloquinoline quinone (PQQ) biosynthesis protein C